MDALTSLLDEMYLSGEVVARFDLTAPWGITMPPNGGIFHAIDKGNCWVRLAPDGRLFEVAAGDLLIFPEGATHDMVDSPRSLAMPLEEALCGMEEENFVCHVGPRRGVARPEASFVCGVFHFRDGGFHAFRSMLPPVLLVRGQGQASEWLQIAIKRLSEEAAETAPGAVTLVNRLTDIVFIEGIRSWLQSEGEADGWLRVLRDPVVAEALAHIHKEPERSWTVGDLAAEVALSRSAFARHFRDLVGMPPLHYVTGWRMQLARNWLRRSGMGYGEMAERLGYASEDAFKRAFRREVGIAPGAYRREARSASVAT